MSRHQTSSNATYRHTKPASGSICCNRTDLATETYRELNYYLIWNSVTIAIYLGKIKNKSMLTRVVLGAIAVTANGGVAGYKALNPKPEFAEVLATKPVTETVNTPLQESQDVVVNEQAPVKDSNRIAGTAIGAVAGGLLGHQIGGGTGRTLATVGGAAAGGYAGNH